MQQSDDIVIVYSSVPDPETGRRIAGRLVEQRLAACVNLIPGVTSVYRWHGRVETGSELLMMAKTRRVDYARLEAEIRSLHPYELPEILSVPVCGGLTAYLDWVRATDSEVP
jgi:periplasmic divalent cation tolerance protein